VERSATRRWFPGQDGGLPPAFAGVHPPDGHCARPLQQHGQRIFDQLLEGGEELRAGDVVVIPAGVAHKRESASADLLVIGAYPRGQSPDLCRAEADTHDRSLDRIAAVPLPATDPVTGRADPLLDCWTQSP